MTPDQLKALGPMDSALEDFAFVTLRVERGHDGWMIELRDRYSGDLIHNRCDRSLHSVASQVAGEIRLAGKFLRRAGAKTHHEMLSDLWHALEAIASFNLEP